MRSLSITQHSKFQHYINLRKASAILRRDTYNKFDTELYPKVFRLPSHRCAINISTLMPSAIIVTADIGNFVVKPACLCTYVKNVPD